MLRTSSFAILVALIGSSIGFAQAPNPFVQDPWVQPITFEVTEAIGSGVKQPEPVVSPAEQRPLIGQAHLVGHGQATGHGHGIGHGLAKGHGLGKGHGHGEGSAHHQKAGAGKAGYPYTWTTRLGMVFMDRTNHNSPYLVDSAAGDAPVFASEMGASIGIKANVIRHYEDRLDREFGILAVFSDSQLNFSVIDDDFNLPTTPNLSVLSDGVALHNYRSNLFGTEYNFRKRYSDALTGLVGFRWISLQEDFLYNITAPGGPQVIGGQTETYNNLFGFQLGLEGAFLRRGCTHLEAGVKAGAYWNMVQHATVLAGVPLPGVVVVGDFEDHLAFEGEAEFAGVYAINDVWNFRVGYQFMWLEGVALAPDQISAINVVTNTGTNIEGSPFFHGGMFQLEARR